MVSSSLFTHSCYSIFTYFAHIEIALLLLFSNRYDLFITHYLDIIAYIDIALLLHLQVQTIIYTLILLLLLDYYYCLIIGKCNERDPFWGDR